MKLVHLSQNTFIGVEMDVRVFIEMGNPHEQYCESAGEGNFIFFFFKSYQQPLL